MTEERSLLSAVGQRRRSASLQSDKPKLKAKNLLPACSSLKPVKRNIMAESQKVVCSRHWEGYSVIWEAATDSLGTGGAVAGVCGASVSCGWGFGAKSDESERSPAFGFGLAQSQLLQRQWEGCWWWEAWGGKAGRPCQEEGSRGPWHSQRVLPLPPAGVGEEALCTERAAGFGLVSEKSCDRRAESILESGGVEESP